MNKATEQRRASSVKRRLPTALRDLGFTKGPGGSCVRVIDGHSCQVGLQKFRHEAAFRVIFSFQPAGCEQADCVVEFSDPYTYRDSPSGRKYDFGIRWGDDAADRCITEIREFVEDVALPWFAEKARHEAGKGGREGRKRGTDTAIAEWWFSQERRASIVVSVPLFCPSFLQATRPLD